MPSVATRGSLEPWIRDDIEYYEHQVEGVRELARRRSFILADDMGLGKSLEALTVFGVDVVRGWAQTAIVIAPPTLKGNWADEIVKFTRFPYVVLDGTWEERVAQIFQWMLIDGPKILICNYEQIILHKSNFDALSFDVAIYDEAHYLKNPEAQRTMAALEIRSRRSFMLTGTPMLNRADELWCLLHRVDPNKFPRYFTFVNRYCVFGGYKNKQVVGVKNEAELEEHVRSRMLRRLKKDVLDLPEVQIIERRVDLHPAQWELYNQVKEEFKLSWAELPEHLRSEDPDAGDDEEIDNELHKFLRLLQICGSTLPFTGEDVSAKLDLACYDDMELIKQGEKIVVFTKFNHVQEAYISRMQERTKAPIFAINGSVPQLRRPELAKEWGSVKGPAIFAATIKVGNAGLNLTAAKHGSFLDLDFVPGINQQCIDRLHRIGASLTHPIQIRRYIARKTVDLRVLQINNDKSKLIDKVVDSDPGWKRKLLKMLMESL